jgi:hypothetical protein
LPSANNQGTVFKLVLNNDHTLEKDLPARHAPHVLNNLQPPHPPAIAAFQPAPMLTLAQKDVGQRHALLTDLTSFVNFF